MRIGAHGIQCIAIKAISWLDPSILSATDFSSETAYEAQKMPRRHQRDEYQQLTVSERDQILEIRYFDLFMHAIVIDADAT